MTMQEYMDEHGHDLPEDGFAEEKVLGECEVCCNEVTSMDAAFVGDEPIYENGEVVGYRKIYLHDECLEDYIDMNVTHEQLAEFLRLTKI